MRDEMGNNHKPRSKHPHDRLTTVSVRAKRTPGRYGDGNGLYLVVDPSGAKRWIWRGLIYGKRCDLGLGGVQVVSLVEAREQARACRRLARSGGDPLTERRRQHRIVPTFKAAAVQVHAEHGPTFRNPKHAAQWLASLENDVFPIIGELPVDRIDSGEILKVLTPIWMVKPETARRLKQRMKLICDWAKAKGFRSGDNPTDGVTKVLPKHRDDKQHHAALPYAEVPAFVTDLRVAPDTSATIRRAFELLILTATRTSEVQRATWAEIDLDQQVWTLPADRTKSGRVHRIPLTARAIEILEETTPQQRADRGAFVFPGHKPGKPLSSMTFLQTARRLTTAPITSHGFRSSFRDWSAEQTTIPRDVCEAALAHVLDDKTEAAYKRTDLFEKRRDLMDRWARFVTAKPAKVLTIPA
jgi:integrase